nr:g patch domain-containing protein 1 [Quercus suber]
MTNKRSRNAFESELAGPPRHAPFALYGTPLPAYDPEARDDGSYVPIWKQEVTDERGRKRLHGAFTGGFSAGYFNTVGSKEGWTPSTFVSSRSNRAKDAKSQGQRVEDFMDEEDLAEQAESQKLETHTAFAGLGNGGGDNASRSGMLSDLFRASGETIGVKLLQKMGWRQGQGVGPKVRRRAKGDEKGEVHQFAPENSNMISFVRKTDRKGLGFAGEEKLKEADLMNDSDEAVDERDTRILQTNRSNLFNKPKKTKKTGIGLGVLNDTGSDEDDPYSMGPRINYTRVAGSVKTKKKASVGSNTAESHINKPLNVPSKKLVHRTAVSHGLRKCHDGRLPLQGFVLSMSAMSIQENEYPPPKIPEGYVASHAAEQSTSSSVSTGPFQSTADAAKASTLNPASRAAVLGEQRLPGKSVFDFLSPAARDRLAAASGRTDLPPGLNESAPAGYEATESDKRRTLWDLVPPLEKATATAALRRGNTGWMPYAEDEGKRARYRRFLELRAFQHSNLPSRAPGASNNEWATELREFAQAAEVFKPISGLMATRFTTSTTAPRLATDAPDPTPTSVDVKDEDPAIKAVKLGMFGPLTRSRVTFYPSRLLCKRFGVRPPANVAVDPTVPDGEGSAEPARAFGDVVSQASIDRMMREASFQPRVAVGSASAEVADSHVSAQPAKKMEVDVERNEALEQKKAGEAVFKAIFGSDDEDDE